jgi:protein SCO1
MLAGLVLGPLSAATAPAQAAPAAAAAAAAPVPSDSLYVLDMALLDQAAETTTLARYRGHPTIVSMFYATCPAACPMLISDIHRLEDALDEETRRDLRVVLVSFDPDADTPAVLTKLTKEQHVDTSRWTLASAEADDVRTLAASLGISYRRLESGHYNHSAVITLLDRDGRPVAKVDGLNQPTEPIVAALR